ncbi:tail fiber assembly protein [Escherichia coli]
MWLFPRFIRSFRRHPFNPKQLVISQTKLLRGRILSEDEQSSLDAWLDYIDAVNALDFNTITDKASFNAIVWPTELG